MRATGRTVIEEGLGAGALGATGVAVWFLIVDLIAGRPFFTPAVLGDALLSVLDPKHAPEIAYVNIVLYTMFHYAAFFVAGIITSVIVNQAEETPSVLAGLLILFVAFELAFHGFVALMQQATVLRALAWYQVMIGNLIAASLVGYYLWRRHPALGEEFAHALDGTGE